MKTLYAILGVDPAATIEQVERAYQRFVARLQSGEDDLSPEETNNQMVAIREAYRTLSNPILRQRYDQKLASSGLTRSNAQDNSEQSSSAGNIFGLKTVALIGLIGLSGLYLYNQNAKERERLRIEHEHEVQMKAVQIVEDQQRQSAKIQDGFLSQSERNSAAQQLRMQQQQFERESALAQQQENQRRQLEFQQQQQQRRDEENRQRQEQMRQQQQLQTEKRLLQQMERDRYGKVITY